MNISNLILNLKKFYPFLFHCIHELKSIAQEGPVPAKSLYAAVEPFTSLKVLKAVPTLKAAVAAHTGDFKESKHSKEPAQKKTEGRPELDILAARILLYFKKILEQFFVGNIDQNRCQLQLYWLKKETRRRNNNQY